MKEVKIKVNGMECEGCQNRIKNTLERIKEVKEVNANYKTGIVIMTLNEEININKLEEKIEDIGFEVVKED